MATEQRTVDFILEQAASAGTMTARKMFGEYGLYHDGKLVGLICDDQLYLKPTPAGRYYAGLLPEESPYPGAKPHLLVEGDRCDDADWLSGLIRVTADALPPPAAKKPKKARPAASRQLPP